MTFRKASLKKQFESVETSDDKNIVAAIKEYIGDSLPAPKLEEVLEQMKEAIVQVQVALKLKPVVTETDGAEVAAQIPAPVIIKDAYQWKADLQVSKGPVAVADIRDFEDLESKL